MATLLLSLVGPLQSWGVDGKMNVRPTRALPTKSAVIGLVAAALGLSREASMEHLAALRFGVREDRRGTLLRDFQTEIPATGKAKPLTYRYYLQDAAFLAALEGPSEQLEEIRDALLHPAYPLYLGKRACPPSKRIAGELLNCTLEEALEMAPLQTQQRDGEQLPAMLVVERDVAPGETPDYSMFDNPVSFSPQHRRYRMRAYKTYMVKNPSLAANDTDDALPTQHNPFDLLKGDE